MADGSAETIVHLLRHGEVYNPEGILYGRRPGYRLSRLGRQMAERVAASTRTALPGGDHDRALSMTLASARSRRSTTRSAFA